MKCPACSNEVKGQGVQVKSSSGKALTVCSAQCAQKINKPKTSAAPTSTPTPIGR